MFGSKLFFTLIGLFLVVLSLCKMDYTLPIVEGWWGNPAGTVVARAYIKDPVTGEDRALVHNMASPFGHKTFTAPSYDSVVPPYFVSGGLAGSLRMNQVADEKYMGFTPEDPTKLARMVTEGYQPQPSVENYSECAARAGAVCGATPAYAAGNYASKMAELQAKSDAPELDDSMPIGTMAMGDSDGNMEKPVIYDRYMFALSRTRTRGLGDYIRGDLPIALDGVQSGGAHFSVHPNPSRDLNTGAMGVLGGADNETFKAMATLVNRDSGGSRTTIGGMDLSSDYNIGLLSGMGDVNVTAYP